ncbi:Cysteine-rich repeat secretory protein 38 [Camellia lanceoleosa]|uniref:Cysteine-rich repeat secretory protein 38 n=1 Tax=Camellia lanceoleosa TaxID=1840588 RepID=A0ACC0GN17_9ERIC|nr:Cysteine-rich repeat secretory protein 38 [Camellia lanceoleosa]
MLSLFLLCDSVSADPKSISCDSSPTNYTPNSRFGNNLKILLESLSSNTPLNQGFNSIAIGNNTDQVYGQALCRGDVTSELCRDCIKNASQEIMTVCPTQNAIIWHEFCQVRYSHVPFFSSMLYNGLYPDSNKQEKSISDRVSFIKVLKDFMNKISDEAIVNPSNLMFVTGKTKFSRNESIYGLVQCTRDISPSDCRVCLNDEFGDLEACCGYRQGGTIFSRNCNMRFQLYQFYNEHTVNGQRKKITVAMLVTGATTFVLAGLAAGCYVIQGQRSNGTQKDEERSQSALLHELTNPPSVAINQEGSQHSILYTVWQLWNEGKGLEMIDPLLMESCDLDEFLRYMHIGLLCVQEDAYDRLTMSSVVVMLKSEAVTLSQPERPAFSVWRFKDHYETNDKDYSVNELTISVVMPR